MFRGQKNGFPPKRQRLIDVLPLPGPWPEELKTEKLT